MRTVGIRFVLFAIFVGVVIRISRDAKKTVGSFLSSGEKYSDFALF